MGIDILIPVLRRPGHVSPLVESIRSATSTEHTIWFICTRGDTAEIDAVREAGLEPLIHPEPAGKANFARKINWAFDQTQDEWVFQGADDIRFSAGWDSAALLIARRTGARVIGTNDLHNPAVLRGRHSTHTLFRRDYILERGGTFDDSGRVFHEGYDHQFVDNEFVETAKARAEWQFSQRSVVEHFHPHWGNATTDATYRKATRQTIHDRNLFSQRLSQIRGGSGRRRRYTRAR